MSNVFFILQLLHVQLYKRHPMATDRVALEQQQRTTTQFVCFPAILGLMRSVHRQENA